MGIFALIVLGIIVTSAVFHYLWPEWDRTASQKLEAQPAAAPGN